MTATDGSKAQEENSEVWFTVVVAIFLGLCILCNYITFFIWKRSRKSALVLDVTHVSTEDDTDLDLPAPIGKTISRVDALNSNNQCNDNPVNGPMRNLARTIITKSRIYKRRSAVCRFPI